MKNWTRSAVYELSAAKMTSNESDWHTETLASASDDFGPSGSWFLPAKADKSGPKNWWKTAKPKHHSHTDATPVQRPIAALAGFALKKQCKKRVLKWLATAACAAELQHWSGTHTLMISELQSESPVSLKTELNPISIFMSSNHITSSWTIQYTCTVFLISSCHHHSIISIISSYHIKWSNHIILSYHIIIS